MSSPERAPRLRRHERRQLIRSQLLDAAERVFARDGFRGASVVAIADEAGYSHGAVYSNFESKLDLFLTLIEERIDARLATVYEAADTELSRGSQLLETAHRYTSMLDQERAALLVLVDFWNQAVRDDQAATKFAERHARLRTLIGGLVEQALRQQGAQLTVSRDHIATAVIALSNGFAIERLADRDAAPDELYAQAVAAMLHGFSQSAEVETNADAADRAPT